MSLQSLMEARRIHPTSHLASHPTQDLTQDPTQDLTLDFMYDPNTIFSCAHVSGFLRIRYLGDPKRR